MTEVFRGVINFPCKCKATIVYDDMHGYEEDFRIESFDFCERHYEGLRKARSEWKQLYDKMLKGFDIV